MTSLDVLEKTLNAYECKITFLSCLYALRGLIVASSSQKCILGYDRMYHTILSILESRNVCVMTLTLL